MKQAKLENMPSQLRDAYLKVAPHPEQLQSFHDKCARRMLEFKDWPVEEIESIRAPTLVIVGDADAIRPEHAVELFRRLPHSQLSILPGGHGAYIGEVTAATVKEAHVQFGTGPVPSKESTVPHLVAALIDEFLDAPMPKIKAR
jgi:pimeloyl-ACP methyl ester carboxylesterase